MARPLLLVRTRSAGLGSPVRVTVDVRLLILVVPEGHGEPPGKPARPAGRPDGRAVLAWVDRFGEQPAIRAAGAPSLEGEFSAPVTVYDRTAALASTQKDSPEERTVSQVIPHACSANN